MSGFVAHKLSGFRAPKEVLIETDRMATGDSEDEIRRAYEGWQQSRLTQEEAARLLGICERTFRRHIDRYEDEGAYRRRTHADY